MMAVMEDREDVAAKSRVAYPASITKKRAMKKEEEEYLLSCYATFGIMKFSTLQSYFDRNFLRLKHIARITKSVKRVSRRSTSIIVKGA